MPLRWAKPLAQPPTAPEMVPESRMTVLAWAVPSPSASSSFSLGRAGFSEGELKPPKTPRVAEPLWTMTVLPETVPSPLALPP